MKKEQQDPKKLRGTSPSGKADQKPCTWHLKGTCKNGDECGLWHPSICKFWLQHKCNLGKNCVFLHPKEQDAAPAPQQPEATPKAKAEEKRGRGRGRKGGAGAAIQVSAAAGEPSVSTQPSQSSSGAAMPNWFQSHSGPTNTNQD